MSILIPSLPADADLLMEAADYLSDALILEDAAIDDLGPAGLVAAIHDNHPGGWVAFAAAHEAACTRYAAQGGWHTDPNGGAAGPAT